MKWLSFSIHPSQLPAQFKYLPKCMIPKQDTFRVTEKSKVNGLSLAELWAVYIYCTFFVDRTIKSLISENIVFLFTVVYMH